jgi:hypothetical protein
VPGRLLAQIASHNQSRRQHASGTEKLRARAAHGGLPDELGLVRLLRHRAAGQRSILELPAGPISIAFESGSNYSKGVEADLPKIVDMDGRQLPVELMGSFQGPSMTREEKRSPLVMRKRFATATIPADGDYAVTAGVNQLLIGTAGCSRKPRAISGNAVVGTAR